MKIYLDNQPLPTKYKRCGKECFLDSIREKLIFITPEEIVRKKIVSYLINELHIPTNMVTLEQPLSHYGINSKKRADIVVHKRNETDGSLLPLAVIECKANGILLGEKAISQVLDYADFMLCVYVMLTDGESAFYYKFDSEIDDYIEIKEFPQYQEMIGGSYTSIEKEKIPPRIPFEDLKQRLCDYQDYDFGVNTAISKSIPILNFWECLLDVSHKLPSEKYELFNLLEDYGVRLLSYGNASGGTFSGPYRSFLIEVNGSTEFISMGISTYITYAKPDIQKTVLNVAIDNEKETHHSLQLVLDDNLTVIEKECFFYHHGRIGVSNLGSGKVSKLWELVFTRYPRIVYKNRFFLGKLVHNKLWYMDDQEIVTLIENLISYALLRDEYRNNIKQRERS